jgi:hypothetical protein
MGNVTCIHYPQSYRTPIYDAAACVENKGRVRFQSFLKCLRRKFYFINWFLQYATCFEMGEIWLSKPNLCDNILVFFLEVWFHKYSTTILCPRLWDIMYSIYLWLWVVFIYSATWFICVNVIIEIEMKKLVPLYY